MRRKYGGRRNNPEIGNGKGRLFVIWSGECNGDGQWKAGEKKKVTLLGTEDGEEGGERRGGALL